MRMAAVVRMCVPVLVCVLLSACGGAASSGGDCVSKYDRVASAPSWRALKDAILKFKERGSVSTVQTQARGHNVGIGDQDAVRVVDLLNRKGRRLAQVEVWRTESGAWRAGIWLQCID